VIETRSSAASDTDRIAYDVLYNVKLSNPNQLEVDERLVRMGQRLWTRPISTNSSVTDHSSRSQWITEHNTTSAGLIGCPKKLTFAFSSTLFWLKDTTAKVSEGTNKFIF